MNESNRTKLERLEPLAEAGRLTPWEIEFCADLLMKGPEVEYLTSGQQEKLDETYGRYCT